MLWEFIKVPAIPFFNQACVWLSMFISGWLGSNSRLEHKLTVGSIKVKLIYFLYQFEYRIFKFTFYKIYIFKNYIRNIIGNNINNLKY